MAYRKSSVFWGGFDYSSLIKGPDAGCGAGFDYSWEIKIQDAEWVLIIHAKSKCGIDIGAFDYSTVIKVGWEGGGEGARDACVNYLL